MAVVKIEFLLASDRIGIDLHVVPATPKTRLGIDCVRHRAELIHAMSSPMVCTFHPGMVGISMAG
jgi:hypothetical protein